MTFPLTGCVDCPMTLFEALLGAAIGLVLLGSTAVLWTSKRRGLRWSSRILGLATFVWYVHLVRAVFVYGILWSRGGFTGNPTFNHRFLAGLALGSLVVAVVSWRLRARQGA